MGATIAEVALKALCGGLFVLAFAALAQALTPKRFAGVFSAAPSVALGSLLVTVAFKGPADVAVSTRGMSHRVFALRAHWVFVPKVRHTVLSDRHCTRREAIMRDVGRDFECDMVEVNSEHSHVHLLVNVPPTVAIAKLVNSLKGVSSRRLRQEFPDLRRH